MWRWTNLVAVVGSFAAATAMAQSWPSKPVRVIVGFAPGVSTDLVARISTAEMGKSLGQPFIIENRPGAASLIAIRSVAQAEPDGYTFVMTGSLMPVHPIFRRQDSIVLGRDISPVADIAAAPWVLLVRPAVAKNWQELVAYSKANPNKVNFGSTAPHIDLALESIKAKVGMAYTPIRYQTPASQQLLSGEIDFFIGTLAGLTSHIQAGKIVPVLFFDHKSRLQSEYPNAANALDLGLINSPFLPMFGFYGPAKLPTDIAQKFAQLVLGASKSPQVIADIRKLGCVVLYQGPEQQVSDYNAMVAQYSETARLINYKPAD